MSKGLRINRRFTEAGKDAYDKIEWSRRDSRITNPDGSIVFEMADAEIPSGWSQVAADIMVSKYFRKAGVPQRDANGAKARREPLLIRERVPQGVPTRPLPHALNHQLPPLPPGYARVILGRDVLLVERRSHTILDIVREVVR